MFRRRIKANGGGTATIQITILSTILGFDNQIYRVKKKLKKIYSTIQYKYLCVRSTVLNRYHQYKLNKINQIHEKKQELVFTFIPEEPAKRCKFCLSEKGNLEHDKEIGWYHPPCLERFTEREAIAGIKLASALFTIVDNKQEGEI